MASESGSLVCSFAHSSSYIILIKRLLYIIEFHFNLFGILSSIHARFPRHTHTYTLYHAALFSICICTDAWFYSISFNRHYSLSLRHTAFYCKYNQTIREILNWALLTKRSVWFYSLPSLSHALRTRKKSKPKYGKHSKQTNK